MSFIMAGDTHGTLDIGKVVQFFVGMRVSIHLMITSSFAVM